MIDKVFATNGVNQCVIMTAMGNHLLHENIRSIKEHHSLADHPSENNHGNFPLKTSINSQSIIRLIIWLKKLIAENKIVSNKL